MASEPSWPSSFANRPRLGTPLPASETPATGRLNFQWLPYAVGIFRGNPQKISHSCDKAPLFDPVWADCGNSPRGAIYRNKFFTGHRCSTCLRRFFLRSFFWHCSDSQLAVTTLRRSVPFGVCNMKPLAAARAGLTLLLAALHTLSIVEV